MAACLEEIGHDPRQDPQPGDCLVRFGANFKFLYRFVTSREGLRLTFQTGIGSAVKDVWLTSWQEWSVNADISQRAGEGALTLEKFFGKCDR